MVCVPQVPLFGPGNDTSNGHGTSASLPTWKQALKAWHALLIQGCEQERASSPAQAWTPGLWQFSLPKFGTGLSPASWRATLLLSSAQAFERP